MKKNNHYKKEIEFKIGEGNEDAIIEFAKSAEAKESGLFYTKFSGGEGFTIGRPPNPFECEGNGLPEPDDRLPHREFHFEFDVRFTLNESDDVELLIAAEDAATHFKFMLKGLSAEQANAAVIDFEQQISNVIKDAIYFHAWACYRKQDKNPEKRKKSYDDIIKNLENSFQFLKSKGDKPVNVREENGIKITTYKPITQGRDKGAKNQKSKVTLNKIIETIKKFKESSTFPTQRLISKRLGVSERTIQRCLESAGIKLKYNDYACSIISS